MYHMGDKWSEGKHIKSVEGFEGKIYKIIRKNCQKKYWHCCRELEIMPVSESERGDRWDGA